MKGQEIKIKNLLKDIKKRKRDISKKLFEEYGLYYSKLESLTSEEEEMILISLYKQLKFDDSLEAVKEGTSYDEIFDNEELAFILISEIEFYEVINVTDTNILVSELNSSIIEPLEFEEVPNLEENDIFFGFVYKEDNKNKLYKNFVTLNQIESFNVLDIYDEYYVEDAFNVFFENIIISRIMQRFIKDIDELLLKYNEDLLNNFDEMALFTFLKHLSNTAKFYIMSKENLDIFNIDYFKFLSEESERGNFVVEGELEDFIDILDYVMTMEAKDGDGKIENLDNLNYCKDNILLIRSKLSKNYPLTSNDLIDNIDSLIMADESSINSLLTLGFFMERISEFREIKITKKTKRMTLDSMRDFCREFLPGEVDSDGNLKEEVKDLLNLSISIMFTNGLANVTPNNEFYIESRYKYFTTGSPVILASNIATAIFRKETLKDYIGIKNVDYEKLLDDIFNLLKTEDFSKFGKNAVERRVIALLLNLEVIKKFDDSDNEEYVLTSLGKIFQKLLLEKDKKGKVLNLQNYSKKD